MTFPVKKHDNLSSIIQIIPLKYQSGDSCIAINDKSLAFNTTHNVYSSESKIIGNDKSETGRNSSPNTSTSAIASASVSISISTSASTSSDTNMDRRKVEPRWPIEKYLFCFGFIFPPAWFIGSSDCGCWYVSDEGTVWKKRCRISTTLLLTCLIVTAAVVMIFKPSTFGLRSSNTSGAQTSSTLNTAVRPGVPMSGSNSWGDALAGTVLS